MRRLHNIIYLLAGILVGTLFAAPESLHEIPGDRIRVEIDSYIQEQLNGMDARYEVEWLREIPRVKLLQEPDSISVIHGGNGIPLGNEVFTVTFFSNGKALRSIYVSVKLHVSTMVWVTKNRIARETALPSDDLVKEERDISSLNGVPVGLDADLSQLISKKTLAAGRILMATDVRKPFLVRKGNRLDLELRKGAVLLSLEVRAMQNGGKGDVIWVQNPETHKRLQAKVVGPALAVLY